MKKIQDSLTGVGGSSDSAGGKVEDFRKKILSVIDTSQQASQKLEVDLAKSFENFGNSISTNLDDTNNKLAQIVLGADTRIKELRDSLSGTDDSRQRKLIQSEIKEQEAILDARKGFEERRAQTISNIQQRLSDAGLNIQIDQLTKQKSLEDEIAESRRLAALDDFTRFEEQQNAKLIKLTEDFISETQLINEKIVKQKALESDLTDFISSQQVTRQAAVDNFANAAISKYGEMANALRTVVSLQSRLSGIRSNRGRSQAQTGGFIGSSGARVHAGEYVVPSALVQRFSREIGQIERLRSGAPVSKTKTINAPINIVNNNNSQVQVDSLARQLASEVKHL